MAAIIKDRTSTEPELIAGDDGIFNVVVEGQLIFSKDQAGRFPEDAEILSRLPG